jgi:DNA-binding PadR family transcriptional regulator
MTRPVAKRVTPNRDAISVVGSTRDNAILLSLAWARFLSTAQVERLHFPSRRTAQRRLRALLDHGLVRAHLQGDTLLQRENIYTLTPRGAETLTETGLAEGIAALPGRVPRLQKLGHALAERDVFVAYRVIAKEGLLELTDFRFEEDLAREPVFRAARLIPDAFAEVRVARQERRTFVEVDLARETTTTLRAKFTTWHTLLAAPGAPFASPTTQLLVTVPGEARQRTVRRILEDTGIASRTELVLAAELLERLRAGYSHTPYGDTVRAVRTGQGPGAREVAQFRVVEGVAFRPLEDEVDWNRV